MPDPPAFPLKVFYDGACSVCAAEMEIYRRRDRGGRLILVDISSPVFEAPPGMTMDALMQEMHAIDERGRIYLGVEAFWAIWHAFPTSPWYRFLGTFIALPGMNGLARLGYFGFARIRKYLPKRHGACDTGVCHR